MTDKPSKRRLYELYWGEKKDFKHIAEQYDVSREHVGKWFREYGMMYDTNHNRDAYIFAMRDRRYYYELYWGQRLEYAEIASRHNLGINFVAKQIRGANVPTRNGFLPAGDPDETPPQYEWVAEKPVAPVTDDPTEDLPDDPDGSKYVADDGESAYDKHYLYELYWGYGCSFEHVAALLNVPPATLRDRFDYRGIPRRKWAAHKDWEPHHGVPPKYEWPAERDLDDDELPSKNGIWRKPTVSAD